MNKPHTISALDIERMCPEKVMQLQIDIQKTLEPFWREAGRVLAYAAPSYIINPQTMEMKVIYPRNVLKALAAIRSNAKELVFARNGIKLHKNYTL